MVFVAAPAQAWTAHGVVRGGGEASGLLVVGLDSRDLREADLLGLGAVDPASGAFSFEVPDGREAFVIAVAGCTASEVRAQRFDVCRRFFPRHEPLGAGDAAPVLQVPDLVQAAALWAREPAPGGRAWRWGMLGLVVAVAGVGAWIRARARSRARARASEPARWGVVVGLVVTALALLLPWLGREPLDLQEYSYFNEGVRPGSYGDVLSDFTRIELAHGPLMPMLLRAVGSESPWMLRLPSVVFGVLFVLAVAALVRREAGERAALVAAGLALVLPICVYYARDATPYAFAGLCAAASVLALLRARDSERPWPWWAAFAALHTLGFLAHYGFAFVSLSQAVAVGIAWRRERGLLGEALLAFAAAAVVPALLAPELLTSLEASGLRFGMMSPVYPESPGAPSFIATFLAVLSGVPSSARWLLALSLPLWVAGAVELRRRAPLLGTLVLVQAAFVVVFLAFTHTMSTLYGGGKVYYAFRWARPLVLGLLVPIAAASLTRLRWGLVPLFALAAWQTLALVRGPVRPAQDAVRALMAEHGRDGDAVAVVPAMFYGDPLKYHLTAQAPGITRSRAGPLRVGDVDMIGPLMEGDLTLETEMDRLAFARIWLVAYREENFGVPKFQPGVAARTVAWLEGRCTRELDEALPFVDVSLWSCSADRAWAGGRRIAIDEARPLQAGRFMDGTSLRLPRDAEVLTAFGPSDAAVAASDVTFGCPTRFERQGDVPTWRCDLAPGRGRVEIGRRGALAGAALRFEVTR